MQTPLSRRIERILFRRSLEKRLEGCTLETANEIALLVEPVTQPMFNIEGARSGRIQSSEPNFTEQDKEETDRVRCEAGGRLPLDHLPEGSC